MPAVTKMSVHEFHRLKQQSAPADTHGNYNICIKLINDTSIHPDAPTEHIIDIEALDCIGDTVLIVARTGDATPPIRTTHLVGDTIWPVVGDGK